MFFYKITLVSLVGHPKKSALIQLSGERESYLEVKNRVSLLVWPRFKSDFQNMNFNTSNDHYIMPQLFVPVVTIYKKYIK